MANLLKTFVLLLLWGLYSCHSAKNITGTYQSNFAVIGFFGTKLMVNADSTFNYRMRGDLMSDTATGKYKVANRYLILTYDPPAVDTTLFTKYGKDAVIISQFLTSSSSRPKMFFIGYNKVFVADLMGNVYKKEQGFSRYKRFLFLGRHYITKRKYYLKRMH